MYKHRRGAPLARGRKRALNRRRGPEPPPYLARHMDEAYGFIWTE